MATTAASGAFAPSPINSIASAPDTQVAPTTRAVLEQRANQTLGGRMSSGVVMTGAQAPADPGVYTSRVYTSKTEEAESTGGGGKTDLGDRLKYDRNTMLDGKVNAPLAPGERANSDGLNAGLDSNYPGGVTFKLPGGKTVTKGSPDFNTPESNDLKHAVLESLDVTDRGTEQNRCVNLNGVSTLVRADVDKAGKATITVIGPGKPELPATAQFATKEIAKSKLESTFGLKVANQPKAWTKDEMQSAYAAFSKLSPEEREALKGIELKRVTGFPAPERAAEFKGQVLPGPPSVYKKSISVGDLAFKGDKNQFDGDGSKGNALPPSVQTIAHEAGHAVEAEGQNGALLRANRAIEANNADIKNSNAAMGAYDKSMKDRLFPEGSAPLQVNTAINAAQDAQNKLAEATNPADRQAAEAKVAEAFMARDEALALANTDPSHAKAVAYAHAQDKTRNSNTHLQDAQSAVGTGDNKREEKFNAYVDAKGLKSPTDYGTKDKSEMYAESFSLYKVNPGYMQQNEPDLYAYFQQQEKETVF